MPDLNTQHVQGGPVQPVYVMNGQSGDPSAVQNISGIPLTASATSGTKAAAGNNEVLPAPGAGKQIVVHLMDVQNESATATTVQLIDIVARFRIVLDQYRMMYFVDWRLNPNTALTMNLSGANQIGYSIQYSIVNV